MGQNAFNFVTSSLAWVVAGAIYSGTNGGNSGRALYDTDDATSYTSNTIRSYKNY